MIYFLFKVAAGVVVRRARTLTMLCWLSEDSHRLSMAPDIHGVHYYFPATLPMIVMVTHGLGGAILSLSTSTSAITLKNYLSLLIRISQQSEDEALVLKGLAAAPRLMGIVVLDHQEKPFYPGVLPFLYRGLFTCSADADFIPLHQLPS